MGCGIPERELVFGLRSLREVAKNRVLRASQLGYLYRPQHGPGVYNLYKLSYPVRNGATGQVCLLPFLYFSALS